MRAQSSKSSLVKTLRAEKRPDGTPVYTPLVAITLMVFYVFALQCVSTVAIVRRETNSWKWPFFQWLYMGLLAWGLAFVCEDPATASNTITAVRTPPGVDSNVLLKHARERYALSLGGGIGELNGQAFRIGHLGSLNELEVLGTIGGIELACADLGIGIETGSGLVACQRTFLGAQTREVAPALAAVV